MTIQKGRVIGPVAFNVRRLYRKHVMRRWHAMRGHRFVQDEIVNVLDLCRCGASRQHRPDAVG